MEKRKRKLVHNLRGQRFGGLVVVSYDRAVSKWRCACDCGNAYYANTGNPQLETAYRQAREERYAADRKVSEMRAARNNVGF